ncbi:uncharacterized protein C14orf119 homolog [Takifugu flavidus]|uniref:Uncharacterized protein n=1 Tax=Takifugu flavidus TaxID=433684 RepID=A0A5C6P4B4_9TELE|nr:uncharacterized protein C14orf119 homolog [Takifugu flavidus]TWW72967.1 hypothetical protein D4764_15G0003610 [Takifugu flavidus]
MSWFHHVNQSSSQQGQYPFGSHGLSSTNASSSGFNPWPGGPTVESSTAANQHWSGFSTPSLEDLPSVTADSPPSLEKLSGFSPSAGRERDSGPISYLSLQEQRCVLSWFNGWNSSQRERFFQDLLGKAVPGKVCTLLDSLSTLQVKDKLPNIFECQLRLWTQWFESWREDERNHFLHMLEEHDPMFVGHFYRSVAGTAGRD